VLKIENNEMAVSEKLKLQKKFLADME